MLLSVVNLLENLSVIDIHFLFLSSSSETVFGFLSTDWLQKVVAFDIQESSLVLAVLSDFSEFGLWLTSLDFSPTMRSRHFHESWSQLGRLASIWAIS